MADSIQISGATRVYGIVGDPVVQVRSPAVYTARFAQEGVDAVLVPLHVHADRFDDAFPALLEISNLDGLLITAPFKKLACAFARQLGVAAKTVGAVNALRREADGSWTGDMFDGAGFVRGIEARGLSVSGRRTLLFGAGGAGSAIAAALAEAGVASISILDIDAERAVIVARNLSEAFPHTRAAGVSDARGEFDLIVNASPVGMSAGDGLPGNLGPLKKDVLVGDVVLSEEPTALIAHAQRFGCAWVNGKDMHTGQIESITSFFLTDR
ncbi:shikimate dehydrogenase [Caballeronia sp. GACF4]|uniref:shikimate dehydrogenase family protein n=1 Tax=Caballeronia sp. GACF4 TaxID=2921763 RepID=UPI002028B588|nr:shikimate dehydrogenase [Caballeronia sp. GACF4]